MAIKKFGQYVLLQVHNSVGELVFETDSLKIDFDIRHIPKWSRAKFSLTNLAPSTIRKLSEASEGNFVSVYTALHEEKPKLIADRMYISNAMEEIILPESIFSMYCYSKLRNTCLEKPVDVKVESPSLSNLVKAVLSDATFSGSIEYKHFPSEVLSYIPAQGHSRQKGSALSILELLGSQFKFNTYTEGSKIVLMYKPDAKNVAATDFYSDAGSIKLATTNMRSNPKIGPATLSVVSNLDPRIKPSTVLDISNLLTIGTDASEVTLKVAENYLREKIAGFSKYQTLSVQHKGSNWTSDWLTQVVATSPTPGTTMPTTNWWA